MAPTSWSANTRSQADRVRYYSIERSDWEEIPLDLVNLERTWLEAAEHQAEVEKQAKVISEEDKAARAIQDEAMKILQDPGVYWVEGGKTNSIKLADSVVHTNKGRSVLARMAPMPVVSGKGTLEIAGAHSLNIFHQPGAGVLYPACPDRSASACCAATTKGIVRIARINLTFLPTKDVEESRMT